MRGLLASDPKYIAAEQKRAESRSKARKCAGNRVNGQPCTQIVKGDKVYCGKCKGG